MPPCARSWVSVKATYELTVTGPEKGIQRVAGHLHLMSTRDQAQPQRLVDEVKAGPGGAMTDADRRALPPLLWTHVSPYGRFRLDVNRRLDLDLTARAAHPRG
ncbi:hypothetical protein ACFCYB_15695 [Streptomyces sp. NPDC056309]|uniref:hypothetical protein n=1 Tax=unclassified Streptomyces TaxID=2593676 RepID=UPI0035E1CD07